MAVFDSPIRTHDQSIDRVLNAGLPVLLVFTSGALPAGMEAALQQAARAHAGSLLVALVPAAENPQSVQRFGARRYPALVAVQNGQAAAIGEGATAADVSAYAAFLLGKGSKHQSSPRPAPAAAAAGAQSGPGAAPPGRPIAATDATFEQEVLRSPIPVLVDFWAVWCGPCRMMEPALEKLARELAGKLKVVKVNVDENQMWAGRYGVQGIPNMLIVRNGQVVDQIVGAQPEAALRSRLAKALSI